jgi:hypothetical protein
MSSASERNAGIVERGAFGAACAVAALNAPAHIMTARASAAVMSRRDIVSPLCPKWAATLLLDFGVSVAEFARAHGRRVAGHRDFTNAAKRLG